MSVNDYRLFRLFFDLLLGIWAFGLMIFASILLLFIGRNQYWRDGKRNKLIALLYAGLSVIMILMTLVVTVYFAVPDYISKVSTPPAQLYGIVDRLSFSSTRGWTSYYMYVNNSRYAISRAWYNDLDVGHSFSFIRFSGHAFPVGFINFTFVGMMVALVVLIGWFFTLYLLINLTMALFDKTSRHGILEFLDGVTT